MSTVLITGGSGLVGKSLKLTLENKGYVVKVLSTNKKTCDSKKIFYWNSDTKEIDIQAFLNVDYIIHLAGANVAESRWTSARKQLIMDSRTKTTQLIFDTLKSNKQPLKAFISSSATGYYGSITSQKEFTETDPPANDFFGTTCKQWEEGVNNFNDLNIRTVILRTAIVLSYEGGVITKLLPQIKLGLGSALGSGNQFFPWIHIQDLCNMYLKAIEDVNMHGVFNAVAPDHITNKQFTKELCKKARKPFFLPNIPSIILRLFLGEMSTIVLDGSKVSSKKIESTGFKFKYSSIDTALNQLLSNPS